MNLVMFFLPVALVVGQHVLSGLRDRDAADDCIDCAA